MDTYASSAGDPSGFYDIAGPRPERRRVLRHGLRHERRKTTPSPTAPLTGAGFTDLDAVQQYAAVVPPSKVILGVPYYGYDWPTAGPGLGDPATGPPTPLSYAQIDGHRRPRLLGPDDRRRAWTSYQVGIAVAPDVLRQPDVAGAQGTTGQHVPPRRGGHLGARDGGRRPRHAGGARRERPDREGTAPGAGQDRRDHDDDTTTTTTTTAPANYSYTRDVERRAGDAQPRRRRRHWPACRRLRPRARSPGSPPTTRPRLCLRVGAGVVGDGARRLTGRLRRRRRRHRPTAPLGTWEFTVAPGSPR